jgi:hypothetical protein
MVRYEWRPGDMTVAIQRLLLLDHPPEDGGPEVILPPR